MEVSEIEVQPDSKLGGYQAKVSGYYVTNGDGGHYVEVTGWGDTEERARQELAEALKHVDFGSGGNGDDPGRSRSWRS